jgi:hypothetical protein
MAQCIVKYSTLPHCAGLTGLDTASDHIQVAIGLVWLHAAVDQPAPRERQRELHHRTSVDWP